MCCNDKYIEDIKALNELYNKLNGIFFENTLSKPVITIQHDKRGQALGWFTPWEAWKSGEETSTEINMSANFLDRTALEKASTLLHEMCHLYAYINKIKDCSRGNVYHNKQFKDIAERHGLEVTSSKKYGFAHTALTAEAKEKIEPHIAGLQTIKRIEPTGTASKKSSTRKYVCPLCGASVRATKEVNISCNDCDARMIEEEKDGE